MGDDPGQVAGEVGAALSRAQHLSPQDAGAVALARRYADLIDEAAPAATYGEPLRVLGTFVPRSDKDGQRALQRITDALAAHSVASDLGPKLLAALTALGLTPAARQAKGGDTSGAGTGTGPLDELRAAAQRRAERQRAG